MTRCTLLDSWFDDESTKIDKFESTSDRQFMDISKKNSNFLKFFTWRSKK